MYETKQIARPEERTIGVLVVVEAEHLHRCPASEGMTVDDLGLLEACEIKSVSSCCLWCRCGRPWMMCY